MEKKFGGQTDHDKQAETIKVALDSMDFAEAINNSKNQELKLDFERIEQSAYRERLIEEVEKWSDKYKFSFQFWGKGSMNVYIAKDNVDLYDTGGYETVNEVMEEALNYIYKINRTPKSKRITQ